MSDTPESAPAAPTRREVLAGLSNELEAAGLESPRTEAERLLCHAVGISRSDLLLDLDLPVDPEEAGCLARASARRLAGVPLQHIEGSAAFRELTLVCDGRALIPRPETEQLVELIVEWASGRDPESGVVRVRRPRTETPPCAAVLDIGTGSGAIALSLVEEGIAQLAVGVDISPSALEQARENRRLAGFEERVELRPASVSPWDAVSSDERFDVIVSNPPYVREDEIEVLARDVRDHEPRVALDGGADGLDVIREIAGRAIEHLAPGGAMFMEVGEGQGDRVAALLARTGPWRSIDVVPDLTGRERFVIART